MSVFKKIFGVVLLINAAILILTFVGQIPQIFGDVLGFCAIFTGKLSSSQIGESVGHIIYWGIHVFLTIVLLKYGVKFIRKQLEPKKSNQ
jgi:thiol:disulfide interchange protein